MINKFFATILVVCALSIGSLAKPKKLVSIRINYEDGTTISMTSSTRYPMRFQHAYGSAEYIFVVSDIKTNLYKVWIYSAKENHKIDKLLTTRIVKVDDLNCFDRAAFCCDRDGDDYFCYRIISVK